MLDEITYRTHGIWYIYSKDFDMQLQLHCINSLSRKISDLSFCPLGVDVHVSSEPAPCSDLFLLECLMCCSL